MPVAETAFALLHEAVDLIPETDMCMRCAELYAVADEFYDRGFQRGYAAAMQEVAR